MMPDSSLMISFTVPVYFYQLDAAYTARLRQCLKALDTDIIQLDSFSELQTLLIENEQGLVFFGLNQDQSWREPLAQLNGLVDAQHCLMVTCSSYSLSTDDIEYCVAQQKLSDHIDDSNNPFLMNRCRSLIELQNQRARLLDVVFKRSLQENFDEGSRADPVTGLASVSLMRHFLIKAMARVLRNDRCLALLYIDVDDFHCINESFGVDGGDRLLRSVGGRLKDCIRTGDLVSRFKDDAFLVVLDEVRNEIDVEKLAHQMLQQLLNPHDIHGIPVIVHASIGIAFYPQGTVGVETLIEQSKEAMQWVKSQGKNGHHVYGREKSITKTTKGKSIVH